MSVHVADGAARLSDKLPIVVRPWVVPVLSVAFLLSAGLGMVVTGPRLPAAPVPLVRDEAEVPGIGEGSGASINGPERDPAAAAGPERRMPDTATPAAQILQPADGSHLAMDQPLDMAVAAEEPNGRVSEVDVSLDGGRTWRPAQPDANTRPRIWHLKTRIPAGSYRLLARALDQAGNVGLALRPVSVAVEPAGAFTIRNPYAVPGGFVKAQLHDHTANSFDGDKRLTPDVKAWYFKQAGYNVVVFTDHEKISESVLYSDAKFHVFPGFESTGDNGHVSGWFVRQVVDYRLPAQQRIDAIRRAGGIACLNHPGWDVGYGVGALEQLTGYRAIEIYNWLTTKNEGILRDNLEKWRQLLNARGPQDPVWGVAVGDSHGPWFNTAWTMLKVSDLSEASVRAAIENGAMYATNGPDFDTIETGGGTIRVTSRNARFLRFLDDTGATVLDVQGAGAEYSPTPTEHWVRIEADDGAGHTAWSEPFWLVPNPGTVANRSSSAEQKG